MTDHTQATPDTRPRAKPRPPIKRCIRAERPEQLVIGGKTFTRNDVVAKQHGCNVRTVNRGDKLGAPFLFVAGVKYRPDEEYAEFLLSRIVRPNQRPERRRFRKAR